MLEGSLLKSGSDVGAIEGAMTVEGVNVVIRDVEDVCSDNTVGLIVGGIDVGPALGATEGSLVVGCSVGVKLGRLDGVLVLGEKLGSMEGPSEGTVDGELVGLAVGTSDGA